MTASFTPKGAEFWAMYQKSEAAARLAGLAAQEQPPEEAGASLSSPAAPTPAAELLRPSAEELAAYIPQTSGKGWKPPQKGNGGVIDALASLEAHNAQQAALNAPLRPAPPPLEELLDLDALRPKRGKGAGGEGAASLARELDRLARIALEARPHLYNGDQPPCQIVMHLPAEMLAAQRHVSDDTLRSWTSKLVALGHIAARPHYTSMTNADGQQRTVIDGTVYAVRLTPGHHAYLTYDDLNRQYRNLDADRKAGRTAYNAIQNAQRRAEKIIEEIGDQDAENLIFLDEKNKLGGHIEAPMRGNHSKDKTPTAMALISTEIGEALASWAVIPGTIATPPVSSSMTPVFKLAGITAELKSVQDVIYALSNLPDAGQERGELVSALADTLVVDLDRGQQHNHAAWCKLLWSAWREEREGRHGLRGLTQLLRRALVARNEWAGLKNPAAQLWAWHRADIEAMQARLGLFSNAAD